MYAIRAYTAVEALRTVSIELHQVVEDFVRNFLVSVGLHRTADIFQAE